MILGKGQLKKLPDGWLPFADAASEGLPLAQLLRLSLFQVSVGMATVLLLGTLNRVMIVELSVPAMVVATMIAIPVLVAPFRALLGHRSDTHRSAIGWKRIPYLWFGSLWQMGGLAVMPFALIVLSGDQYLGPDWAGEVLAALAFLMTGLGLHMTQTAGLALACDRATDETRPRVVALLYVMFLLGMALSAVIVGWLLRDFDPIRLVRVVQGCGVATLVLNIIALWKQEKVRPMTREERAEPRPRFAEAWGDLMAGGTGIGIGGGLFAVATLTAAMTMPTRSATGAGLALGAWGAAQATAAGLSIFVGGSLRDVIGHLATAGRLGPGLTEPVLGYTFVYHLEIGLLFATLVALGPLVRIGLIETTKPKGDVPFGIAEFPT